MSDELSQEVVGPCGHEVGLILMIVSDHEKKSFGVVSVTEANDFLMPG
jgi:hypothetical protein